MHKNNFSHLDVNTSHELSNKDSILKGKKIKLQYSVFSIADIELKQIHNRRVL